MSENTCIHCQANLATGDYDGLCWRCNQLFQEGYQKGLRSHPAPTDLLLTEESKQDLNGTTALDGIKGAKHKGTPQERISLIIYRNSRNLYKTDADKIAAEILKSGDVHSHVEYYALQQELAKAKAQLSKLQQARSTEHAREKIAEQIYLEKHRMTARMDIKPFKDAPPYERGDCLKVADQILRLIPDEQATEKRVRKEITDYIDAVILQIRKANEKITGEKAWEAQAITKVFLDKTMKVLADSIRQDDMTIQEKGETIWTIKDGWIKPTEGE